MQKSIISVISIACILVLYCVLEVWYFDRLITEVQDMVDQLQQQQTKEGVKEGCDQISRYFQRNQLIIKVFVPRSELEMIVVALGRVRGFADEDELFEARVAAREIPDILIGVHNLSF